jgi:hypothetical protein
MNQIPFAVMALFVGVLLGYGLGLSPQSRDVRWRRLRRQATKAVERLHRFEREWGITPTTDVATSRTSSGAPE